MSAGPPPKIVVAPNDKWKNPINYDTHVSMMGEHDAWQVEELKAAIREG